MDTIWQPSLDGRSGPKYRAVSDAIRDAIGGGILSPGTRLPPVRDLAWQLKITPGTVARAYSVLSDAGVLKAEVGRGTFVADPEAEAGAAPLQGAPWVQHETAETDGVISLFSPRLPDLGQVALIRDAFARLSDRPARDLLDYPTTPAFAPARRAALRWLEGTVLGPIEQENLVLTHGGQSGISLVMQAVLKGRAPVVMIEELSYPGFRRAAQLLRAEVVGVPMDAHGLIPEALDEIAARHDAQILCTSPEVHNPTGIVTPTFRREAIADVARRRGFHILEDDCYRIGRAAGPAYRALLPDQGWHVSSISKALTPALRIGFAVAPQVHQAALRRAAEYGFFGLARPLADLAEDLLTRSETYAVIDRLRGAYATYIREAVNILGGHDLQWHDDTPFLWLTLPDGWRAASFARAAEAQGVQLRAAEDFALRSGSPPHAVRMAINAQVSLDSFAGAMRRVRGLLDNPPETIGV
ncbi:aminotransferase-like domain-containing protein [Anianabacter salinae]|uniref:aminotransferase-like domain-containing protein n=1 Tax=Anianabacter salinae TaxID=2851023 RepID=UPI00225E3A61|nr:PLP-dependent aminotransferase family protein [Anianabacter salinae]MBV0912261.1 PLP-dependent aminotransferase family protein [Anianabacter salinae]